MKAQIVRLTMVLLAVAISGCHTAPSPAPALRAAEDDGISVHVASFPHEPGKDYFTPGVLHTFSMPMKLTVHYPTPPVIITLDGKEVQVAVSDFEAVIMPLPEEDTYSLMFEEDPPLLVIHDGAIYATGRNPAVSGRQVGTLGDGTGIILEAGATHEYVYLIHGTGTTQFRYADRKLNPIKRVDRIHIEGRTRGYRWDEDDELDNVPEVEYRNVDPRKKIVDQLKKHAQQAGLFWPPDPLPPPN